MDGHINGISKESYLQVAEDPKARASFEFDIMEYVVDKVSCKQAKCDDKYLKKIYAWIAGAVLVGIMIGKEVIPWSSLVDLIL